MAQPAFGGRLVGYARVSTNDHDLASIFIRRGKYAVTQFT
jgi:hypothetical protein